MTTIVSILAQTKTGAIIEIIILLLVAGIIAFLTAYFYYKPIYLKKIHELEQKNEGLQNEVSSLRSEITGLEDKIAKMEKKGKGKK